MYKYFLLFIVLGFMSCNGGCNGSSNSSGSNSSATASNPGEYVPPRPKKKIGANADVDKVIERQGGNILKQACSLVPLKTIADALGMTPQQIKLQNATPPTQNPTQSACFFKWEDYDLPNAGMFIQMLRNPFPDEYPDYLSKYVESYRIKGEQSVDETPIIFKKFEGFGDDGSYSTEAGKYYWRLGDKISFLIAFNSTHTPEEQYRIASILAGEMTEAYLQ